MESNFRTLLVDLRLKSIPPDEVIQNCLVYVLEKEVFSHIKLSKLRQVPLLCGESVHNKMLESDDGQVLVLIRIKKNIDYAALTLTLDMTGELHDGLVEKFDCLPNEAIHALLKQSFKETLEAASLLPFIRRCQRDSPYLTTSDKRIIEFKFSEVLFSAQSPFQKIQIVDTPDFGRFLILDAIPNLAESDTIQYTHFLMNLPTESYKGKEVLILGGGDGGLLHELLKLGDKAPSFVTMVDIDEMVLEACSKYMSSVCGEYLKRENWDGPNHKVIVGDALKYLEDCQSANKKFDYIFGDLTDIPVSTGPRGADLWMFLKTILEKAINNLKPNIGKCMTHCTGKSNEGGIEDYEKMLTSMANGKCSFTKTSNFVNSFMETWIFYQITVQD